MYCLRLRAARLNYLAVQAHGTGVGGLYGLWRGDVQMRDVCSHLSLRPPSEARNALFACFRLVN